MFMRTFETVLLIDWFLFWNKQAIRLAIRAIMKYVLMERVNFELMQTVYGIRNFVQPTGNDLEFDCIIVTI